MSSLPWAVHKRSQRRCCFSKGREKKRQPPSPLTWFYIPSLSWCTWSRPLPSSIITAVPFSLPLFFYIHVTRTVSQPDVLVCFPWSYLGAPNASWSHESVCVSHLVRSGISYATALSWLQKCAARAPSAGCLCAWHRFWGWRVWLQWIFLTSTSFPASPLPLLKLLHSPTYASSWLQVFITRLILENLTLSKHKTADNHVGVVCSIGEASYC